MSMSKRPRPGRAPECDASKNDGGTYRCIEIDTGRHGAEGVVARYRVHFIDQGGKVYRATCLNCDNDGTAIKEAYRLDIPGIGRGFDLWYRRRLVYRLRRPRTPSLSWRVRPRAS